MPIVPQSPFHLGLAVLAGLLLAAHAAATPPVDLGSAATYAVSSSASGGNTDDPTGAPHTTLHGDLGVKADTQPTGFPPGVVTGSVRVGTTPTPTPRSPAAPAARHSWPPWPAPSSGPGSTRSPAPSRTAGR